MRAAMLAACLVAAGGCGKSGPTGDWSGAKPAPKQERKGENGGDEAKHADDLLREKAEDYAAYTGSLKSTVPLSVDEFTAKGFKADHYTKEDSTGMFKDVTLVIKPVYLSDKVTGKTERYAKAKLTRNNPAPAKLNKYGGIASIPEPYAWAKVEMIP